MRRPCGFQTRLQLLVVAHSRVSPVATIPAKGKTVQQFGSFDYVIVGAGSAGCLLANRLSLDPDTRVLLIEAGGRDNYFWIPIPVGYLYTIANPRTDWCYKTEPDEHLAGRSIHYARGRVLGGCSSINAMIYMRGQKEDWDHWAALGNRGWAWDDVLPVFKSLEDYERGATDGYGAGGEVRIEDPRVRWDIIDAWREAAAECGIPPVKMFNGGDNFGCAYFQMNQRRGRRWSASHAFLRPALQRKNSAAAGAGARATPSCGRRCSGRISACSPGRWFRGCARGTGRRSASSFPGKDSRSMQKRSARRSSPPAPSARRSCCSCPA